MIMSLSLAIEADKKAYYEALQEAQRSNEISRWIKYFVATTLEAQEQAEKRLNSVCIKPSLLIDSKVS